MTWEWVEDGDDSQAVLRKHCLGSQETPAEVGFPRAEPSDVWELCGARIKPRMAAG